MHEVDVFLPRSAFSPREAARAGDLWRAFQDVAVGGSIQAGWPPERYREEGVSFIVRSMVVLHHRETMYGERLRGSTWPSLFRRGVFFRRECRIADEAGASVASATQEWVHVSSDLKLVRASDALATSFAVEAHGGPITLPAIERHEGGLEHRMEFTCWHTWMDPLGHVNHPAYVDWADEALSRVLSAVDIDPVALEPVAESAHYRGGVRAGERVSIATRPIGRTERGDAVFEHRVRVEDRDAARILAVRRLRGETGSSKLLEI